MRLIIFIGSLISILLLSNCNSSQYARRMIKVKPNNKTINAKHNQDIVTDGSQQQNQDLINYDLDTLTFPNTDETIKQKTKIIAKEHNAKTSQVNNESELPKASQKIKNISSKKIKKKLNQTNTNKPDYFDSEAFLFIVFLFLIALGVFAIFALFVSELWPLFFLLVIIFGFILLVTWLASI